MSETDFWSPTIAAFAPLGLTSPELTPKLLKKPPFRFIHDLVRAINERFDAYTHVIPPPLDNASAIETKEQKVQYLTILINYVNQLLQVSIDVNPKKIVSGNEPEKTNIFLQYVAMAVGNAQKDKIERQNQQAAVSVAPPPPPPPPPSNSVEPHPNGMDRSALPKAKKDSSKCSLEDVNKKVKDFQRKIGTYSLNVSGPPDVQEDGKKIVAMWNELNAPKPPPTQSTMPQEALEIAVARQIEAIRQIETLNKENDEIIQNIEGLLL
eukprot:gene13280-9121_t